MWWFGCGYWVVSLWFPALATVLVFPLISIQLRFYGFPHGPNIPAHFGFVLVKPVLHDGLE